MTKRIFKTLFAAASLALAAAVPSHSNESKEGTVPRSGTSPAQDADPAKIIRNAQQAFFYQGESFRARVKMTLTSQAGSERLRELTMLRINMPQSGDQRFFMYFHAPGDVRRMAFLVYKYPAREDDRWLFIPALNLVQRIASKDAQSSFVGSDFTYEDISGRDVEADEHKLLREEERGGKLCYVIESVPKGSASYKRKVSWIDKTASLPLKEEYYDVQDQLFKEFAAEDIQEIDGLPTIMKRAMKNVKAGHKTVVEFSGAKYRLRLKPEEFSERALRNPPGSWIK